MSECKKFDAWMMDAARGELAPRDERELLAHTGECAACREAYRHARELANLVDRGLESLVDGGPSAQFASRLRARIAEERSPARTNWFTWRPAAAALALAALMASAVLLRTPQRTMPQAPSTQTAPGVVRSSKLPASQPQTKALASHPQAAPAGRVGSRRQFAASRVPALRGSVEREPEVLVPPGQLQLLMQFASDIRSGRIDGKQLVAADAQIRKPLDIAPLAIAPLEEDSTVGPPSGVRAESSRP